MTKLSIRGATIHRAKRLVVEDASFTAPAGAVTMLLGQAGAGKTSLLAAIAGLIRLERGAVLRDGVDVTRLAPRKRGIAMLAPGSTLTESAGIGGVLRRLARAQAGAVLDGLGLSRLAAQDMATLSHGEALLCLTAARLARTAPVLLVDEAGAGLDDDGTVRLLALLRAYAAGGVTVLAATRAARVALAADHLVLLAGGRVVQAGTPAELYAEPRDALCAALTGEANILSGTIRELRPGGFVWSAGARFVQATEPGMPRPVLGQPVTLCVRPERLVLLADGAVADNAVDADVATIEARGPALLLGLNTAIGALRAVVPAWPARHQPVLGQRLRVGWAASAASLFPLDQGLVAETKPAAMARQ